MCVSDNNGYLHSLKVWAYRQDKLPETVWPFFTKLWKCKLFRKELQIFSAYKVLPSFMVYTFQATTFLQSGVYLGLQVSKWHLAFANMKRWTHVPTNNFVTTKISWLQRWPNFITHGAPLCLRERQLCYQCSCLVLFFVSCLLLLLFFFFHIAFIAACVLIACSLERRSGNIEHWVARVEKSISFIFFHR